MIEKRSGYDAQKDEIQKFIGIKLPLHLREGLEGRSICIKAGKEQIEGAIDFRPPFLKIEKIIVSQLNDSVVGSCSIGCGTVTMDDMEGHYNNTIFLAFCGRLMGQSASTHLALLFPNTAPQIVKVERIEPILTVDGTLWKPNKDGSVFFVETVALKKKLNVIKVNSRILFGDILFGIAYNATIVLTPKNSIYTAKELPR